MSIRRLVPDVLEKVWGSPATQPWLANPEGRKIGEIWFSAPEAMPVLVKFLFTSERLSVQVHPDDAYALGHGHERGKTEMWHILRAEAGAKIALGLRENATGEQVRAAALNGDIVEMLRWIPAQASDTFFIARRVPVSIDWRWARDLRDPAVVRCDVPAIRLSA